MNFSLKIIGKVFESDDTVTIQFKQPALKKFKYISGQYTTLVVRLNNRAYRRAYSLSSVFGLDSSIDITVKLIPEGVVSNYLFSTAKVGDTIEVMEPAGSFVLPTITRDVSFIFWCAGSGITPAYSLIRDLLHNNESKQITLVYCNRKKSSVIFHTQLTALTEQFKGRFRIKHIFSRPEKYDEPYFFEGRISKDVIHQVVERTDHFHQAHHYVCGPTDVMELISTELILHNISLSHLHRENFHQVVDPVQLEGVVASIVNLDYQNTRHTFPVEFGRNILECLLDQSVDFPYSCQTGSCTFCKATIEEGAVKTISHQRPEKSIGDNECLLCCSYPLSETIKLKA